MCHIKKHPKIFYNNHPLLKILKKKCCLYFTNKCTKSKFEKKYFTNKCIKFVLGDIVTPWSAKTMMNLFNKHLCTLGGGGILNCVQCVKNTKKLLHFSQRLPLLFIFSYLPPHWDARYRPKKRLPSFLNKTKKEWKKFMRAYPRFRRNYRGVSRIMLPVLEDFFKIRIEAYQKTRDRDDKKLCKFGQIKHNRGILHTSVCRPTNHCHFFNFSSHQRMVRQSKTP